MRRGAGIAVLLVEAPTAQFEGYAVRCGWATVTTIEEPLTCAVATVTGRHGPTTLQSPVEGSLRRGLGAAPVPQCTGSFSRARSARSCLSRCRTKSRADRQSSASVGAVPVRNARSAAFG